MKLEQLLGKQAKSLSGKTGYVLSANFSGLRLTSLVVADENERELFVDLSGVISIGERVIFDDKKSAPRQKTPIRLGAPAFDERGSYLGVLKDIIIAGGEIKSAKIGKKNHPAEELIFGDAVIVKSRLRLKEDVKKEGKILFKKGTPLTGEVIYAAADAGEMVQTTLKSL